MGPVLCLPPIWQDSCLPLPSWLAFSSLPPQSQCPSTLQLFLEAGTTTEMLEGPQTLPLLSTPGLVSSTRSSSSGGSRNGSDKNILVKVKLIRTITFGGNKTEKKNSDSPKKKKKKKKKK